MLQLALAATHSPVLQHTGVPAVPQEVVVSAQSVSPVPAVFWHVLAAPPPPAVIWHTPHVPTARFTVPARLAALPQNGAIALVHVVTCGKWVSGVHCCYPQYET